MQEKVCTGCVPTKAATDFHWLNKAKKKLDPRCKMCRSETARLRYIENRDHILAINTQWREDNRNHHRLLVKEWEKAHPDKGVEKVQRRRARKAGVPTDNSTRLDVWCQSDGACHLCGQEWDYAERWEIDHVVPLSLGGDDTLCNKAVACGTCNKRKSNRLVESGSYA